MSASLSEALKQGGLALRLNSMIMFGYYDLEGIKEVVSMAEKPGLAQKGILGHDGKGVASAVREFRLDE